MFRKPSPSPREKAIFVVIAIFLMLFVDQFVLGGWRPYYDPDSYKKDAVQEELGLTEIEDMAHASAMLEFQEARLDPIVDVSLEIPVPEVRHPLPERPAWEKNAIHADFDPETPKVVIIIDDLGIGKKRTAETTALPGPLTMAFLPYAPDVSEQAEAAREAGHELMIHAPMEPLNSKLDPGPEVLKTDETEEEFEDVLHHILASVDGVVGINNHMGSKLTQDPVSMGRIMAALRMRGLLFVDSRTIHTSVAADTAHAYGVPYAERDVFLDHTTDIQSVRTALAKMEYIAKDRGLAIGIGHPKENTLRALREWLPTLKDKGIVLVPVSAVVTKPSDGALSAHFEQPAQPLE